MTDEAEALGGVGSPPDQTLRYGDAPDQLADLRFGAQGAQRPLILLLHGGFWKPEYDRAHTGPMATALALAGWSVLTVEYRRIPGNPDATLQDLRTAIAVLPPSIEAHDGRLLLLGHSAGGHLALWAAAERNLHGIMSAVALAPTADLQLCQELGLGGGAVRAFLGAAASDRPDVDPMQLPAPSMPVTILHGDADEIVPIEVSRSYHARFPATKLVELPGIDHYAVIIPSSRAWERVIEEIRRVSEG